ncbi:TetR/AcrR family transcriptional regulator [Microbacterium sp. A8/3-1]|uniref:TetR/AcrR family transcriptional regulator n=1 Tax=Microbacterium sp. A8/3-1 TaxID=3160749 RepID=A0AAU7W2I4_9MICO
MSRELILKHLVGVIAAKGTGGLSVRTVATAAGVAIGTVQHHFPTKSAMLLAAMETIRPIAVDAYAEAMTATTADERLRNVVDLLIPSAPSSVVGRVWLAFAAHSITDAEVSAKYQQLWSSTRDGLATLFAAAAPSAATEAIEGAALEMLALLDGLSVTVLTEPGRLSRGQARTIAARHVDSLLRWLNE